MSDSNYNDVIDSLTDLRDANHLTPDEEFILSHEIKAISSMIDKLENGKVEIAAFGEVSSGKSALLNALLGNIEFEVGARAGVTLIKDEREWKTINYKVSGFSNSCVMLVDTPGINEVDGKTRAAIAQKTVKTADIVLFVVKGDLTETEYASIKELHTFNKPIIVALSKVDILKDIEKRDILEAIHEKLDGIVNNNNIIATAGDPNPEKVTVRKPDGSEHQEVRPALPMIEDLQMRILNILDEEGKALLALNAAVFGAHISDKIAAEKVRIRKECVQRHILKYSVIKGSTVALNPIPLADILGGAAIDTYMIYSIGKIYGIDITLTGQQKLGWEIAKALGLLSAVELGTNVLADLIKGLTLGLGTVVVALPQGLAAAYGSYLVGSASHEYFANGASWGEKGAKTIVKEMIKNINKKSIMAELKEGIKSLLKQNSNLKKDLKELEKTQSITEKMANKFKESIQSQINEGVNKLADATSFEHIKEILSKKKKEV